MNREEILYSLGKKVREKMERISITIVDCREGFEHIKELALYINELISDEEIMEKYKEQIEKTEFDSEIVTLKLKTFSMLRNVLIHFPYYNTWNDVYITPEMLTWNKSYSTIEKYFEKYSGKQLHYSIYMRDSNGGWEKEHEVYITVPELKSNTKLYIKDFVSIEDTFWTFCSIDSMLEYLNIGIIIFSHYSV